MLIQAANCLGLIKTGLHDMKGIINGYSWRLSFNATEAKNSLHAMESAAQKLPLSWKAAKYACNKQPRKFYPFVDWETQTRGREQR